MYTFFWATLSLSLSNIYIYIYCNTYFLSRKAEKVTFVLCFLLGDSLVSEFYVPRLLNTL